MFRNPWFRAVHPNPFTRRRRARRGGVLLEAMLGMMVASFITVSGLSLMVSASSVSDGAKQSTIAYNIARQQIENMRSLRGAQMANVTNQALTLPELAQLNGGAGTLTVQTYRDTVKRVSVTINWRAGQNRQPRTMTVTTLMAPGGVTK